MTRINEKMGLRPAGQRRMMKLPQDRELRTRLTSAVCPSCGRTGANLSRLKGEQGWFRCSHCNHPWNPEPQS